MPTIKCRLRNFRLSLPSSVTIFHFELGIRYHEFDVWAVVARLQDPGGTPHNGLYGEAPAERRTFFRLRDESVGILLVDVNEKVGKSVIWVCERAQKG